MLDLPVYQELVLQSAKRDGCFSRELPGESVVNRCCSLHESQLWL